MMRWTMARRRPRRSLRADDVIEVLLELFQIRRAPEHLRSDNGPQLALNCEFELDANGTWFRQKCSSL